METVKENTKPNLVIVKIDETSNWRADIQENAKRIFGYYLVDLSIITHLCEITGSLYCEFLYNRFECIDSFLDSEGQATDELTELEFEGESMYISENSHLDIVHKYAYDYDETEGFEEYDEFIESVIGYYKANPVE
jgi:hypothetical protein